LQKKLSKAGLSSCLIESAVQLGLDTPSGCVHIIELVLINICSKCFTFSVSLNLAVSESKRAKFKTAHNFFRARQHVMLHASAVIEASVSLCVFVCRSVYLFISAIYGEFGDI